MVTSEGEALTMFPALNIDQKIAREGLAILEQCLWCECHCPDPVLGLGRSHRDKRHKQKTQPRQHGRYHSEFSLAVVWSYPRSSALICGYTGR